MANPEQHDCNCDYYELTEEEQKAVDDSRKSVDRQVNDLLLKVKTYDTPTKHQLGCPIDIVATAQNQGDFYLNCDTWSARQLIIPTSKGLLVEGPVLEDKLTPDQVERRAESDRTANTRLIGLYRA